jgi:hypothetical protein
MTVLVLHAHGRRLRCDGSHELRAHGDGELVVHLSPAAEVAREAPAGRLMVSPRCVEARERPYALVETDDEYVLRNFGFFEAHIAKTFDRITCWADPSVPAEMVPVLITGNLMNFVMWLEGDIGLHASTVLHGEQLIAVMGFRNMGKSTTASALVGAGCTFFGDDLLRVTIGDPIIGHRGTPAARLRTTAWQLGPDLPGSFSDDLTVDGRRNLTFALPERTTAPLGVVVVPKIDREAETVSLERVSAPKAVELYHRLARINGVTDARLVSTYLDASVALAERIPMVIATLPFRTDTLHELGPMLLRELDAAGLVSGRC